MAEILILEDDIDFAGLAADVLSDLGHRVAIANTASEAYDLVIANDFEIMIVDVFVKVDGTLRPGEGGLFFLSRIRNDYFGLGREKALNAGIIAISGSFTDVNQISLQDYVRSYGADYLLPKPLPIDRLAATVEAALGAAALRMSMRPANWSA